MKIFLDPQIEREITKATIRVAIIDVLSGANVWAYGNLIRRGWLTKRGLATLVFAKYPNVAKNDESIFRELRRMVEDGEVERNEDRYSLKVKK